MSLHIHRSALVMHSSSRMFELVNDVHEYPLFLPWCSRSSVIDQGAGYMVASLEVSKGAIRQSFATRNEFVGSEKIRMSLVDGPFSMLSGEWRFLPLDDNASKVELLLDFDIKKSFGKMAFAPIFNQAANSMVDAFCTRANKVYG